ncbi:UNVERIFIED_CONTAM: hypothetical protein Scaly_2041000 [Sesamum calycinum]|uniref:Transposase n=1 Tax=Sesamum calycinum TaxID=2727403 RepID=A0AAW2N3V1_9LAMI
MDPVASGDIGSAHGACSDKIVWTPYMELRFIEFMHEEFISHRLQSSTFSPSVWARNCEKMNSAMYPSYVFTTEQLKGKLNRLHRVWRLMNDILNRGTGWGWDSERHTITDDAGRLEELYRENPEYKKIVEHGLPHFDLCTQMFAQNPASELSEIGTPPTDLLSVPSGSKRQARIGTRVLQLKKCKTMDKLNKSLQGKIDRSGPKATDYIERCVDELTKFKDLSDVIFTTTLECFHSHSTPSTSEGASHDNDSSTGTPSTPGSPGSDESDVPEEFYYFRDVIWPELFQENVPRNTSVLQGEDLVVEIMSTPHAGRFYDNNRMTKPCFYALVDALSSRGLLPQGQAARASNIEEVAILMQIVGMHKRHRDSMERFQHSLETIHHRFHRVLSTLCALAPEMITRPNWTNKHPKIASNPDFYPYFKDCIGTMDDTLVPAWAPRIDLNKYRSRKGRIAQNVLAICDFDLNFTYVYAGWEGRATDARVLDHAILQDRAFPFPPLGKYYLVDAGFANYQCFLAPYRGTSDDICRILDQGQIPTRGTLESRDGTPLHVLGIAYDCNTMWIVLSDTVQQLFRLIYPLARRYLIYPEPLYPSMLEVWGRTRAGRDLDEEHTPSQHGDNRSSGPSSRQGDHKSPIVILDSIAPSA